jgi:hypothetical protein
VLAEIQVEYDHIELMALQHLTGRRQRFDRGRRHPARTQILAKA